MVSEQRALILEQRVSKPAGSDLFCHEVSLRLSDDQRHLILSRYTELNADQKLLLKQLKLDLPPQPPPRITSSQRSSRPQVPAL